VLFWSRGHVAIALIVLFGLFGLIYGAPILVIVIASLARQWNGFLPSEPTLAHFADAVSGDRGRQLWASLATGAMASLVALVLGTWAALALRGYSPASRRFLEFVFFIPSAVPSVSVGLGLLVAFSQPPVLLNGTVAIVVLAHLILVSAFAFGSVSAGLASLPADLEPMAESLGARPFYRLTRVTLPLLLPYLLAALSLSIALSMGELGATAMVYPPGWVTLPVGIFSLTDRGDVFLAAALTVILIVSTLIFLVGLSLVPTRAASR